MICPNCSGEGRLIGWYGSGMQPTPIMEICKSCEGDGRLTLVTNYRYEKVKLPSTDELILDRIKNTHYATDD